jgi:predicted Zn-dependent peptidase
MLLFIWVLFVTQEATMSNNKQSSIEWFLDELIKEGYIKRLPVIQFQQAKAMQKEEMINFTSDWYHNGLLSLGVLVSASVEEHYNKTFKE